MSEEFTSKYRDYNLDTFGRYMECGHGIKRWCRARSLFDGNPCIVCNKRLANHIYCARCERCERGKLKVSCIPISFL